NFIFFPAQFFQNLARDSVCSYDEYSYVGAVNSADRHNTLGPQPFNYLGVMDYRSQRIYVTAVLGGVERHVDSPFDAEAEPRPFSGHNFYVIPHTCRIQNFEKVFKVLYKKRV